MKKDEITSYLDKLNYEYSIKQDEIVVKLDFSLQIIIDLSIPATLR